MVVVDLKSPACVLTLNRRKALLPATASLLSTTKEEAAGIQRTHLEEILASPGTPTHSLISDEVVNDKLTPSSNL